MPKVKAKSSKVSFKDPEEDNNIETDAKPIAHTSKRRPTTYTPAHISDEDTASQGEITRIVIAVVIFLVICAVTLFLAQTR